MKFLEHAKVNTDRLAAWLVLGLGFLVLFLGYRGTSGTGLIAQQLSYIVSGGIFGLSLISVGAVLWLSADLRDQWRELYAIRNLLEEQEGGVSSISAAELTPAAVDPPVGAAASAPVDESSQRPVDVAARVRKPLEEPRRASTARTPATKARAGRTSRSAAEGVGRVARQATEAP